MNFYVIQHFNASQSSSLPDYVTGYDKVWFIGDDFSFKTFDTYMKSMKEADKGYVHENFEVTEFMSNKFNSIDTNIISVIHWLVPYGTRSSSPK